MPRVERGKMRLHSTDMRKALECRRRAARSTSERQRRQWPGPRSGRLPLTRRSAMFPRSCAQVHQSEPRSRLAGLPPISVWNPATAVPQRNERGNLPPVAAGATAGQAHSRASTRGSGPSRRRTFRATYTGEASAFPRRIRAMVVVLGIDPGTAHTGYGVVLSQRGIMGALDGGVIGTGSGEPLERRLVRIHARMSDLISEHRPDAVAIEELYFGQNARSAFAVGQARGVVLLGAGMAGIPCFSYTPQAVKSAVCGSGAADKAQVQRMVGTLLSLPDPPEPDHAADALAVAVCHANGAPLRAAVPS